MRPFAEAVEELLKNQKLIADGQSLVEKHLAAQLGDDGEKWRRNLEPDGRLVISVAQPAFP
jgi:hypothetical protein